MAAFLTVYNAKNGEESDGSLPDKATWTGPVSTFSEKAKGVGIQRTVHDDVHSLRELMVIGLKDIAVMMAGK